VILAVDTHYGDDVSATAGVWFADWGDGSAQREETMIRRGVEAYRPGEFFRRELPPILELLAAEREQPRQIVIDGYVWLDAANTPGLGAHLFEALQRRVAVVGVAKTAFKGSPHARAVLRGSSASPLYVTAAGMDLDQAAANVRGMHGEYRVPTLLRQVDRLCRDCLSR